MCIILKLAILRNEYVHFLYFCYTMYILIPILLYFYLSTVQNAELLLLTEHFLTAV